MTLLKAVKLKVEKAGLATGMPTQELDAKIKESIKLAIETELNSYHDSKPYIQVENIDEALDQIVVMVIDGFINIEDLTFDFYDREKYLEEHVTKEFSDEAIAVITSLYEEKNEEEQGLWFKKNHVQTNEDHFCDEFATFVIIAHAQVD
ncbi:hypothetical protein bcgnr5390_09970 [Bacillus luti]|nr:hypothetical protein BC2903_30940 [Bacillus cereus]